MPRFRLFATDLDGTLFSHDMRISARNREALARLHARGVYVVLATGRMFRATTPIARELAVVTPLITYQGALIRHHETLADTWHRTLPLPLATEALEALEATGMHVNLYVDDTLFLRAMTPEAESYLALARVEARRINAWVEALTAEPTKLVAIGPEAEVLARLGELKRRFGDRLFITQSQPTFLEITHPEVNKGLALAHLAGSLGVAPEEIVAVGDGMNDAEMIRYAGLGVAMGNAREGLKAVADRTTCRVEEDGLAALVDDLIAEGAL